MVYSTSTILSESLHLHTLFYSVSKTLVRRPKAYILLTDLAHNLLADFKYYALQGSRFEEYGLKRIVRDLLCLPGLLTFNHEKLVRIEFPSQKQNAADLLKCLQRYHSTRFS